MVLRVTRVVARGLTGRDESHITVAKTPVSLSATELRLPHSGFAPLMGDEGGAADCVDGGRFATESPVAIEIISSGSNQMTAAKSIPHPIGCFPRTVVNRWILPLGLSDTHDMS